MKRTALLLLLAALSAAQSTAAGEEAVGRLPPAGWDAKAAADAVLARLLTVTAPAVRGAHDADLALADGRAYVVAEVNDHRGGESADWPDIYVAMSIVNLGSGTVERVVRVAASEQVFANETLPAGACFVPRLLPIDARTLRCFFSSERPGRRQSQTWFIDFDIAAQRFENRIRRAKLKTAAGVVDMQPRALYADAVRQGFAGRERDFGLFAVDSFKTIDGRRYVALNNYPAAQNALAAIDSPYNTFEVIGHFFEAGGRRITESAVQRMPDGTWLAICRQDGGDCNYLFTSSRDGRTWTPAEARPFVSGGGNSKPTFDRFGGLYYLGWQEGTKINGVGRSVFNIDVSRDGASWVRKYRFETDKSFQYPIFREYGGGIYLAVTQGDTDPSRKERIAFARME